MLVAMMAILMMTAFGTALILSSSSDTTIAGALRDGLEGRYAAGAMLARGLDDLAGRWTTGVRSSRPPSVLLGRTVHRQALRTLADGSSIDLSQVVNMAHCQKAIGMLAGGYRRGNPRPAVGRE